MTGEHLERPKMIFLRNLMAGRRIAGIIFPALDRLSREPLHQQIFELEAAHYGVQLQYSDAPSGNDPGSQFARTILAHAAKLVKIANRKNNRGGNIGRVVNKNVPAGKTPYGYRYKAKYEDLGHLRRKLISATWEIDSLDHDGQLVYGSEAWSPCATLTSKKLHLMRNTISPPSWGSKYIHRKMERPFEYLRPCNSLLHH